MTVKGIRSAIVIAVAFAAGALLAASKAKPPVFTAVVFDAEGKASFALEKKPRPDFVYVGFPAGKLAAAKKAHHKFARTPLAGCPNPHNANCTVPTPAASVGGTIICLPGGDCNPPTHIKQLQPNEQLILVLHHTAKTELSPAVFTVEAKFSDGARGQ